MQANLLPVLGAALREEETIMSQQINLLNPALIKQKDFLNPNNIVITLGLLSALMLGYYGYAQKQLSLLNFATQPDSRKLSATQAQLQQTTLLHTPHEINKALIRTNCATGAKRNHATANIANGESKFSHA